MYPKHILLAVLGSLAATGAVALDLPAKDYGISGPLLQPFQPPACMLERGPDRVAACLPPLTTDPSPEAAVESRLQRAIVLFRIMESTQAVQQVGLAVSVGEPSPATLHLAARLLVADIAAPKAQVRRADEIVDRAHAKSPDDLAILATKAYIQQKLRRADVAMALYDRVLAADPRNVFSLEQKALYLTRTGRFGEVGRIYDLLIEIDPADIDNRNARASNLMRLNRPKEALADLALVTAARRDERAQSMSSKAHALLGDYQAAVAALDPLIDGYPNGLRLAMRPERKAEFRFARSLFYLHLGKVEAASNDFLAALEMGGLRELLKIQVFLANRGLDIDIDGKKTEGFSKAVKACLAETTCQQALVNVPKIPDSARL